jgi:mannose-1-phosphate guanylyltransferase
MTPAIAADKPLAFAEVFPDHPRRMTRARPSPRYAVIMAGGFGTRFWPQSRRRRPKQFLAIRGRASMLQETARRLRGVVRPERVLVVATAELASLVRKQLPELERSNLLVEPAPRGTAACLALAAEWIARRDPNALMSVFPADHVIDELGEFRRALRRAFELADREGLLVTFGIAPTHPETGYGYIEPGAKVGNGKPSAHRVARFHEKPDAATAAEYGAKGFLWNSGMFVWRVDAIRMAFARHAPRIASAVRPRAAGERRRLYRQLPIEPVDRAILERAPNVAVVRGGFGWSDVGSWAAMASLWGTDAAGNARRGPAVFVDSRDAIVYADKRLVAVVGTEGLIVVDTPDALLVCPKSRAQDVRRVVDALAHGRFRHLL